jgi:peptidoglycan-associated lipoprotein
MSRMNKSLYTMLALTLVLGACSKKPKEDTEVAAGDEMMVTGVGSPIAELGPVYFEFDSFSIKSESRSVLDTHATWLKANAGVSVQIEGHCDERGTTEYNLALGERRAGSVKDYLVSKGVPASRLSTISYGEERPAKTGVNEMAWAQNRRAEFVSAGK